MWSAAAVSTILWAAEVGSAFWSCDAHLTAAKATYSSGGLDVDLTIESGQVEIVWTTGVGFHPPASGDVYRTPSKFSLWPPNGPYFAANLFGSGWAHHLAIPLWLP